MTDDAAKQPAPAAEATAREQASPPPARISLVYESKDGRLCIFEDAHGHLTSVRSSKLA